MRNAKLIYKPTLPGGGGSNAELPLTQPPQPTPPSSAANTLRTGSCPGTPEMQRRREEAVRRLAAKVRPSPQHLHTEMWLLSSQTE